MIHKTLEEELGEVSPEDHHMNEHYTMISITSKTLEGTIEKKLGVVPPRNHGMSRHYTIVSHEIGDGEKQIPYELGMILRDFDLLDRRNIYGVFRQLRDLKVTNYSSLEDLSPNSNVFRTIKMIVGLYRDCPEQLLDYCIKCNDRIVRDVALFAHHIMEDLGIISENRYKIFIGECISNSYLLN